MKSLPSCDRLLMKQRFDQAAERQGGAREGGCERWASGAAAWVSAVTGTLLADEWRSSCGAGAAAELGPAAHAGHAGADLAVAGCRCPLSPLLEQGCPVIVVIRVGWLPWLWASGGAIRQTARARTASRPA
jgi:hypothetical protein